MTLGGWWFAHGPLTDGGRLVAAMRSDMHPDGAHVDVGARASSDGWSCAADLDADGRVVTLRVASALSARAGQLWFGELPETAARPPAINLIALSGHGISAGRLLDAAALAGTGVRNRDQLGALRWYPATGEVDQVYVDPAARRAGIASALLYGAGILAVARGWPRLWGDGQRTELGERLRETAAWRERAAPLTHLAPPMTPTQ